MLSRSVKVCWTSNALDNHRDALSYSDAHGAQRVAPAAALQLIDRGRDEARTRRAERMTERDRAAIRVDVRSVVGNAVIAQYREHLCGEGFVELDHVDVGKPESCARENLAHRRRRAEAQ